MSDILFKTLDKEVLDFAYCLNIKVNDSNLSFTDYQHNIKYLTQTFKANAGFRFNKMISNDGGDDSIEIEFNSDFLANNTILGCQAELFMYIPKQHNLVSMRTMWIVNIIKTDHQLKIVLNSSTINLKKNILEVYSSTCRAQFGDAKCKVDKKSYATELRAKVLSLDTLNIITTAVNQLSFLGGEILFENSKYYIISSSDNIVKINKPINITIDSVIEFMSIPGCDKKFDTCCEIYHNALNFRGEPHIPAIKL